jgi:DNA polymerase-3 subunit alpha
VERGNTEKVGMLLGECRAMGIEVLPPHVSYSEIEFKIEDRPDDKPAIRHSMAAIKNVGEGPVQTIMDARAEEGPFRDIDDFCTRVDLRSVGRKALEMLIKVGALDEFASRDLLLAIMDRLVNLSSSTHKASAAGQMSMFDIAEFDAPQLGSVLHPEPDGLVEISEKERLGWEKELAGTYLSDHPIQKFMPQIKAAKTTMLGEVDEALHGQQVTVAGMINSVRPHQTKKGAPMAFVEIEDIQAAREIVVFPRVYEAHKSLLVTGNLIVVRGKVDAPDSRPGKVLADSMSNEITTYGAVGETPAPYQVASPPAEPPLPLFDPEPSVTNNAPLEPPPNFSQEPEPPLAAATNGHANGHTNGSNGHATHERSQPEPVVQQPSPPAEVIAPAKGPDQPKAPLTRNGGRVLELSFTPSGNLPHDKHCMRMAFDLLTRHPGKDSFYINIGGRYTIEFPESSTHVTTALSQKLAQISGLSIIGVNEID